MSGLTLSPSKPARSVLAWLHRPVAYMVCAPVVMVAGAATTIAAPAAAPPSQTINVPPLDRFQIISEHSAEDFIYDANYLDIARTEELIIIQITLNVGRTTELKRALYARIAELLAKSPGVRQQDVFINLVEVPRENWSFGNGIAQYAT